MHVDIISYIVMEIQVSLDGTVATIINNYTDRREADSKFFQIMASAVLSNVPIHGAVLLNQNGDLLRRETYTHE